MLPRSRVHLIPAGKAPRSGADAVKASYLQWSVVSEGRVACPMLHPIAKAAGYDASFRA
jgi:hypothetical protein